MDQNMYKNIKNNCKEYSFAKIISALNKIFHKGNTKWCSANPRFPRPTGLATEQ